MTNYSHKDVLFANRAYYDKTAEDYRKNESYAYSKNIIEDVTRIIVKFSNRLEKRERFLDFGCGSGFLSEIIFEQQLFNGTFGVDISETQINLYNKKFAHERTFAGLIGDITRLPFYDHTFDMTASYSVLHHIFNYKLAIKEIKRLLKPNGILFFDFEPNRAFRKVMALPLKIRRKLFDRTPHKLDNLEFIAEYHHNIEKGINIENFVSWLQTDFDILEVGPRYPESLSTPILKCLSKISQYFMPYFYIVAQKK